MEEAGLFNDKHRITAVFSTGVILERHGRMDKSMYKSILWHILYYPGCVAEDNHTVSAMVYVTDHSIMDGCSLALDDTKPSIEFIRYIEEDSSGPYEMVVAKNMKTGRGMLLREISL